MAPSTCLHGCNQDGLDSKRPREIRDRTICCCCQVASVVSDSVWPRRQQPTRLPRPWDSPGKITGVGCHFLLQCMIVKSESEVVQSCATLSDPMDCSLLGSSVHGIFQARVLEWGAIAFSNRTIYPSSIMCRRRERNMNGPRALEDERNKP